jgi:hypothetical protein
MIYFSQYIKGAFYLEDIWTTFFPNSKDTENKFLGFQRDTYHIRGV